MERVSYKDKSEETPRFKHPDDYRSYETQWTETINGLRIPPVYAYVATAHYGDTIYMNIELYTVGTMRIVGTTNLRLRLKKSGLNSTSVEAKMMSALRRDSFSGSSSRSEDPITLEKRGPDSQESKDMLEVYNTRVPNKIKRNGWIVTEVTNRLWRLEQKIWSRRRKARKKEKADMLRAKKARKRAKQVAQY
ncbi:hypothetical protein IL306_009680 [Fusarium sp. DS 682]|nr:hypothetical protein IL306_009680 [Fusarium sp. DS 682]